VLRTGDGSHEYSKLALKDAEAAVVLENNNNNEFVRDTEHFWGFGKSLTLILFYFDVFCA
jgi:hypothetical protein